jgi:tetraacyldisaccharide 4'-kinase
MYWLEKHWYRLTPVSLILLPVSWAYCCVMRLRGLGYRWNLLRSVKLSVPVIVVGNITVGGTGKTPLVIWLVAFLKQKGLRPGIVTRGYQGRAQAWPQLVLPQSDPEQVGDEAVVLARRGACPVVADPDRVRAAQTLVRNHGCDVIVSDDGLQHLRLARDIEIAVIDGERRFGNGWCLPAGPLREPKSRLNRVSLHMINGRPRTGELGMEFVETGFCRVVASAKLMTMADFKERQVHAVAGIGHPSRFFAQLRRLGFNVIEHPFPDHHRFSPADIAFDDNKPVIMTQKDAVKCESFATDRHWCLFVEARPDPVFGERVWQLLEEKRRG